ncbi:hypothetical protein JMJ55_16215 [Belnapia sp. T6]|uniref:Uncharacterized protein n=1 Tax=Belnapia mucosa TaxID=2804532 RepID=A0ABS1V5A7_9PROT|nr:hypothetical protein [Belnapia mucosa]MBL6456883.1 hypothetical protein [Belnapia mucosa]
MRVLLVLGLIALAPLAGCGPAQPYASLPQDAVTGIGDPTRAAVIGSAYAFAGPGSLSNQPDAAARAAAQVEYLATEIPTGPRWVDFNPTVGLELQAARRELRGALGIAGDAPPQAVVDGLFAASRALRLGNAMAAEQALTGPAFPDGRATLARLAKLPDLPRTRSATALTERELYRVEQDNQLSSGGDGAKL